jgi:taurine transport system permease protein
MAHAVSEAPVASGSAPAPASPQDARRRARRRQRLRRLALHATSLTCLILIWWLVTEAGLVRPLFLPSPGEVWDAFVRANTDHPIAPGSDRIVRGEQNYYLWEHLLASLQRIAIGVAAAIVVGIPLGLVMGTTFLGTLLGPYLDFLRSLPPLAYIGLLIV